MLIEKKGDYLPILCFLGINQGDKNNVSDIVLNNIRSLYDLVGRKTGTKDHRAY
jgi:hypothetical protein